MLNMFKPCRSGILIGGIYFLVAVPCAFMHWHEYSIPAIIVYFTSMPVMMIFQALNFIGVQPTTGDGWFFRVCLIITQTAVYFLLAEALSFLIRKIFVRRD